MDRWSNLLLRFAFVCVAAVLVPAASASAFTVTAVAPTVTEGTGDTPTDASFKVSCELLDVGPLTVTPAAGTAPAASPNSDFEPQAVATPALAPCTGVPLEQTVVVRVIGDAVDELNENFKLDATLGATTKSAPMTIVDDDVPEATIAPAAYVVEGTATVDLLVTLSQTPVEPATVTYATEDSSALAGSDYTTTSGQLTIPAGQTTGTISVPLLDDATPESLEAFYVNLSSPVNATLNDTKKQAVVGIFDLDKPPVPAASVPESVTVKEGDAGTVNVLFAITLSIAPSERVQLDWRTGNYTANLADYESANGTVTFEPGQTTKTVSVNVKGDTRDEPAEAFVLVLGNPRGATIAAPGASFGVINDDDGPKVGIGRPVPRGKSLVLVLSCPKLSDLCKGRLDASIGKVRAGRKAFELQKDSGREITLKLSRRARTLLAKRARRIKFTASAADSTGATRVVTRRFRVKRLR